MNDSTEVRLENLERELALTKAELCRMRRHSPWLVRGGFLVVGFLALTLMFLNSGGPAQARKSPTAHRETGAKRFVVVDEKGRPRAILGMNKDGPGVALLDEKGNVRASMGLTEVGPVIALLDEGGKSLAVLKATTDGTGLALLDEGGKGRVLAPYDTP